MWPHPDETLICSVALANLRISCSIGRKMSQVSVVVHSHLELHPGPCTECSWHLKYAVQVNCWQQELFLSTGRRIEPAGVGIALASFKLRKRLQAELIVLQAHQFPTYSDHLRLISCAMESGKQCS